MTKTLNFIYDRLVKNGNNEIVKQEELIPTFIPGSKVTTSEKRSLSVQISKLRKEIESEGIISFYKDKGYLFIKHKTNSNGSK